jgi:hypothetical protein
MVAIEEFAGQAHKAKNLFWVGIKFYNNLNLPNFTMPTASRKKALRKFSTPSGELPLLWLLESREQAPVSQKFWRRSKSPDMLTYMNWRVVFVWLINNLASINCQNKH